jgi:hypothetical protein
MIGPRDTRKYIAAPSCRKDNGQVKGVKCDGVRNCKGQASKLGRLAKVKHPRIEIPAFRSNAWICNIDHQDDIGEGSLRGKLRSCCTVTEIAARHLHTQKKQLQRSDAPHMVALTI